MMVLIPKLCAALDRFAALDRCLKLLRLGLDSGWGRSNRTSPSAAVSDFVCWTEQRAVRPIYESGIPFAKAEL